MAAIKWYSQCLLQRVTEDGHLYQRVFLPLELCDVRATVTIEGEDSSWLIIEVADNIVNEDILESHRKAWKRWDKVLG